MSLKTSVFEKTDNDTSRFNASRFNPRGSHGDVEAIGLISEQAIERSRKSAPGYTANKANPRTKLKSINVIQ